jgi:CRISPR-associated protein Cas5t
MNFYSVDIRSFTSSFRYPMLISGTQLTLEVPPVSTIMGLINAACGKYLCHFNSSVGYYFEYQGKGVDIETIYMAQVNKKGRLLPTTRSNAIRREFLFEPFLRLYSTDEELINYFRSPVYPLLLGRSSDLATADISSIQIRSLDNLQKAEYISGQVIPYAKAPLPGKIQALAKYFTDSSPRQMLGREPYVVINCHTRVNGPLAAFRDNINGKEIDIYMHQIDSLTL